VSRRPIAITLIGWLFILVGCGSLVSHVWRFTGDIARDGTRAASAQAIRDLAYANISAVVALVAGVFLLRGRNWARWLCVIWLGFHVLLSYGHSVDRLIVHSLLFVGFTYLLFRPQAAGHFRGSRR
jgi:hypothetical protein